MIGSSHYKALISLPVINKITNDTAWSPSNSSINGYTYCYANTSSLVSIAKDIHNNHTQSEDSLFLWMMVPQVFNGLAQLLVHIPTLKFLCPSSSHCAGISHWSLVCHVQHLTLDDQLPGPCFYLIN